MALLASSSDRTARNASATIIKPTSPRVVSVSLIDRATPARLWLSDLEALDAMGVSRRWYLAGNGGNKQYVSARIDGLPGLHRIARLILNERRREVLVRYADGDARNLCRDNLILVANPCSEPNTIQPALLDGRAAA